MKKIFLTRILFIMACAIFLLSTEILSQSLPYLGQTAPGNIPIRLVPDSLAANSEWQYHGIPTFSHDGTEMYYAIYRFNPGRMEIWFTECVNGVWVSPQKAPFSNNNYQNNNPYFSSNKDTLYFLSFRPNGLIFRVTRTNGVWSSPVALNLSFPYGYYTGWEFSIADNGNIYSELSFQNDDNIYIWRFVNGRYQSPERLSAICSPQADFTPYVDPDERFIIFSSRRPGGFGNTDMYISKKNSDDTWAAPINLGQEINSGDVNSPIMSRDGKYFFYNAWLPGDEGGNPYWVDAKVVFNLITDVKDEQSNPTGYNLFQNYPNPFNPSTVISYFLPSRSMVSLKIYDLVGKEIATLVNKKQEAGTFQTKFDATELSSGIYFYNLITDNYSETKKMIFLK